MLDNDDANSEHPGPWGSQMFRHWQGEARGAAGESPPAAQSRLPWQGPPGAEPRAKAPRRDLASPGIADTNHARKVLLLGGSRSSCSVGQAYGARSAPGASNQMLKAMYARAIACNSLGRLRQQATHAFRWSQINTSRNLHGSCENANGHK